MFDVFLEFAVQQFPLVGAWITLVLLLLYNETRRAGKAVSPQQVSDLLNRHEGLVVDVRDHSEFRNGHIVGSVNIPFRDLEKRSSELKNHKDKPVIVVCKMGQLSGSASKQLKAGGFTSVYTLTGGISEWTSVNFPLVK